MSSGPKIKGAAVREFLRWYAQRTSHDDLRRAVKALPDPLQALFDADAEAIGVLPSSWYDSAAVHALIDAIFVSIPPAEHAQSIRDGARFAVQAGARGIYRFVLERLTPDIYVRNIQRLWNMLHDNGTREIVMTGSSACTSIIRDWPGHHPALCLATTETMAALLELMGCRDVDARRVACVSSGAPECVSQIRWTRG